MPTRTLLIGLLLLAACFVPTDDHTVGSGSAGGGSGGGSGGSMGFERCVDLVGNYGRLCTTVFPVVCGGATCASGQVCCQTTGNCIAAESTACPKPPSNVYWIPNPTACGSSADCSAAEYCMTDEFRPPGTIGTQRCIGNSGHCQPINNCGYCSLPGSEYCTVCGCDGRTYASIQTACVAGVSAIHQGACGVSSGGHDGGAYTVSCGTNAQCPANAQCCFRTGLCFDASEPWRCEVQPNGTMLNCASHEECESGAGGGSGNEPPTSLCAADGCGGPGLCLRRGSTNDCGGAVQQVCGCDGVTYVNACWARAAGTRVASNGACP